MSTEDTNDDQLAEAAPPAGGAEGQEQAQPQHKPWSFLSYSIRGSMT